MVAPSTEAKNTKTAAGPLPAPTTPLGTPDPAPVNRRPPDPVPVTREPNPVPDTTPVPLQKKAPGPGPIPQPAF